MEPAHAGNEAGRYPGVALPYREEVRRGQLLLLASHLTFREAVGRKYSPSHPHGVCLSLSGLAAGEVSVSGAARTLSCKQWAYKQVAGRAQGSVDTVVQERS